MMRIGLAFLVLGSTACGATPVRGPDPGAPRPATAARIRFEPGEPPPEVQALTGGWIAEGLPARSGDGRTLAVVETGGDGIEDYGALLVLSALDGSIVQRLPLFAWSAADDVDDTSYPAFVASLPPAMTHASEMLARGDYRALAPIPSGDPPPAEGLVLRFAADGTLSLHDADGRVRFEGQIPARTGPVVVAPDRHVGDDTDEDEHDEDDEDEDDEDEDDEGEDYEDEDGEDPCAERSLEMASAWHLDSVHVLLHAVTNNAVDECYVEHTYRVVELAP